MDSKEKHLVDELCRRCTQQIFHERDVLALLILLRGHSAAESPVRELADFIAHRELQPELHVLGRQVESPRIPTYWIKSCLSARRGSDPRPSAWEADALPAELLARNVYRTLT